MEQVNLSVVIAAYNEEDIIRDTVTRVVAWLSEHRTDRWELIVCNDGSRDRTGEILDALAAEEVPCTVIHHRRNYGQGRALRSAFTLCRGDVIVTLDADLSYGPENIGSLTAALERENVEIALASPYARLGTTVNVPFYRWILSKYGNHYLSTMIDYSISTVTCVVRAYRREVIDTLLLTADGMELQLEILQKASFNRFRVCECPAKLEWAAEKADGARFSRVSKMRILATIRTYLFYGWLSHPSLLFVVLGTLLAVPGLYMLAAAFLNALGRVVAHLGAEGVIQATSDGLRATFEASQYTLVIGGFVTVVGLLMMGLGLLVAQNKFHFEQVYRLIQDSHRDRTTHSSFD